MDMPLPMDVETDSGTERIMLNKKGVVLNSTTLPQVDPEMFYLKKVVLE
jgi:hypothetical protein